MFYRRSDTKVVIPVRNMKDVFVSFYHHMLGEDRAFGEGKSKPWSDFFSYLLHSKSGECSFLLLMTLYRRSDTEVIVSVRNMCLSPPIIILHHFFVWEKVIHGALFQLFAALW